MTVLRGIALYNTYLQWTVHYVILGTDSAILFGFIMFDA